MYNQKSAVQGRVRNDIAERHAHFRNNAGYAPNAPDGISGTTDVYGRRVHVNAGPFSLGGDTAMVSVSPEAMQNVAPHHHVMAVESATRPYMPITKLGASGVSSDAMGRGRDLHPKMLYGPESRGEFVESYPPIAPAPRRAARRHANLLPPSHNATRTHQYRG